jgi:hypothetical protein
MIPLSESVAVWWQYNLSASRAVSENISKARKAKHFSGKTVRLALQWPSMSTRVLPLPFIVYITPTMLS